MLDKKYCTLFNNHLVEFLALIKKAIVSSECEGQEEVCRAIAKCYSKYKKVDKKDYIDYTLQKFRPHMKYIICEDSYMFSNEYSPTSMKLISGLDFKSFWEYLEGEDQSNAWKHLHRIYINGCFALGQQEDPAAKRIIKNIQETNCMQLEVAKERDVEDDDQDMPQTGLMQGLFGMMDRGAETHNFLDGLFQDDNNVLIKLVKEVSEEMSKDGFAQSLGIDPNQKVENPMEAIMSLFGQPEKLGALFGGFTSKFEQKMRDNNIGQEDLMRATTEMGQKIVGEIPGMADLGLNGLNPEEFNKLTPEEQEAMRKEFLEKLCVPQEHFDQNVDKE